MSGRDEPDVAGTSWQLLTESKKKKRLGFSHHSLFKFTTALFIAIVLFSVGIAGAILEAKCRHHSITLAISSDVIECAKPSLLHQFTTIEVNEITYNHQNDNPRGLTMELFTLNEIDIIHHSYVDYQKNYELILPTSGPSRFIMPYNYYNRPWYLWKGSTIRITLKIVYKEKPSKADLYLFQGEKRINSFLSDKVHTPPYEGYKDILSTNEHHSIIWQVQDNDYYYVGMDTSGSKDTIFQGNFTFSFSYVDIEDYPWLKGTAERATGVNQPLTLHHSISLPNFNRTLCYIHPIPPTAMESDRIYLKTTYLSDVFLKLLLIATPFGLLALYLVVILGWLFVSKKNTLCHGEKSKVGYIAIN